MRAQNGKLPMAAHEGHWELSAIWRDVGADDPVRCAVLRGDGMGFSGGGDLALVQDMASNFEVRARDWKEAGDLVYNVVNCYEPTVNAMQGPAVGAGLVAGLLADISVAAKSAKIFERVGPVSLAVNDAELLPKACKVASWRRQAGPTFDTSHALEFMGIGGPDVYEGVASLRERRTPRY